MQLANASGSSRPFHRVLASGAAAVVAAPLQPPTLPAECRDGSAEKAVVVTFFRYDQVAFPSNRLVQPKHPYEVILTNTCQQRAISRLSININSDIFRSYVLIPCLRFIGYGIDKHNLLFMVLPPLGAPDNSVIIPPGATLKFNTTVSLDWWYNITVIAADFSR
ncbi:hypothetical protein CLOM_g615 [Closterium sp. NIES-68]|nr:hypothetical protein CLOM_g615 [Closterium sp. NIES-68]